MPVGWVMVPTRESLKPTGSRRSPVGASCAAASAGRCETAPRSSAGCADTTAGAATSPSRHAPATNRPNLFHDATRIPSYRRLRCRRYPRVPSASGVIMSRDLPKRQKRRILRGAPTIHRPSQWVSPPMEAIAPAYGAATLMIIAALAVALLLFLIMKVKLHAFVALVLVSVVTAIAAGIPVGDVPDALIYGFADTIGSVALLVGFGVMIGRLLEVTGGAQVLADTLINRFGEQRAPLALGVAALLFGFPIFFDAGLMVFLPIILTVARRFGGSLLLYGLPAAGAFAAMHALVPPHPGPVAAAEALEADIGLTLLVGVPVAVLSWYVGVLLVSRAPREAVPRRRPRGALRRDERRPRRRGRVPPRSGGGVATTTRTPPAFGTVLGLLLLPLVLISFNTVLATLITAGHDRGGRRPGPRRSCCSATPPVALLITTLVAIFVLGRRAALHGRRQHHPRQGAGADLLDHPHHRRRRHVRWRPRAQRHRRGAQHLAVRPRHVPDPAGLPDLRAAARRAGLGHGGADHRGRAAGARRGGRRSRRPPAGAAGDGDRRRRHRALPRQRLGLLARQPVLRHGREDDAEDLDGHGDDARPERRSSSAPRSGSWSEVPAGPRDRRATWSSWASPASASPPIAQRLAADLGLELAEGDDFHPRVQHRQDVVGPAADRRGPLALAGGARGLDRRNVVRRAGTPC